MANPGFRQLSPFATPRQIAEVVNNTVRGKINTVSTVTLIPLASVTTVSYAHVGPLSYIGLMPTSATAATEMTSGALYIASRTSGSFVIGHASNSASDRTFTFVVLG